MPDALAPAWWGVAAALAVAIAAGVADWRRRRRADLDRMGVVEWRSVQMLALIAAAMLATLAIRA